MMEGIKIRRRNLPHWTLEGATYFISFRLIQGQLSASEVKLVLEHIKSGDKNYYDLLAVVVMPDHVYAVLQPRSGVELKRIMKGIKGASARKINLARGSQGSLWQDESYDRIVRDQEDLEEKLQYILNNPIKESLAQDPFDYPGLYFQWGQT